MNASPAPAPPDKAGRTLMKAFTFAGAILGVGAYGLARCVGLFAEEWGWVTSGPRLGPAYGWILSGAAVGLLAAWLLVKLRPRG